MAAFVAGIFGILGFYLLILVVGYWASRKQSGQSEEELMLAGRKLGGYIGALTLIATWVGGGYINGASEMLFTSGLVWAQAPVGYSLSLLVGAILFVKPLRKMNIITLLDPFQKIYGNRIGGLLFIPAIFGDFFWVASILNALGSSLVVITELDPIISIIVSAIFIAAYTSVGAMYSVTYTDVVQLFLIMGGLVLCIPFAIENEAVSMGKLDNINWIGKIEEKDRWMWADLMLLLIMGGIPFQGYVQRILAINSTRSAQILSSVSTFCCMLMAVPAALIGVVARAVDWNSVPSFNRTLTSKDSQIILPLVLRHLTPEWVAFFGLGAVTAAMMSSADSSVLSFSSMFTRNVYKNLIRPLATELEITWVLRITVLLITTLATVIALTVPSVYYLAILSSDLIYVIMFPNLLLLVYWGQKLNTYGFITSFFLGTLIRILSGEPGIGIPVIIQFPGFDPERGVQLFPYRTLAMLTCLITHAVISQLSHTLFTKNYLKKHWDVLEVFSDKKLQQELKPLQKK